MKLKKICIFLIIFSFSWLNAASCKELMSKYNAPDPSVKTMKQLKRWVKRKVKDENKAALEECLVARAADNPNKETVAGE